MGVGTPGNPRRNRPCPLGTKRASRIVFPAPNGDPVPSKRRKCRLTGRGQRRSNPSNCWTRVGFPAPIGRNQGFEVGGHLAHVGRPRDSAPQSAGLRPGDPQRRQGGAWLGVASPCSPALCPARGEPRGNIPAPVPGGRISTVPPKRVGPSCRSAGRPAGRPYRIPAKDAQRSFGRPLTSAALDWWYCPDAPMPGVICPLKLDGRGRRGKLTACQPKLPPLRRR
jgi:hypothetical protein